MKYFNTNVYTFRSSLKGEEDLRAGIPAIRSGHFAKAVHFPSHYAKVSKSRGFANIMWSLSVRFNRARLYLFPVT